MSSRKWTKTGPLNLKIMDECTRLETQKGATQP
jgi:hypothetical protein